MKPITVSQLNSYMGSIIERDPILSDLEIIGEISNLKYHHTGHIFFSIKDERSRVNCFVPSGIREKTKIVLKEGMEVILVGRVSVFHPGGYYSFNVEEIKAQGMGSQSTAFEKLKMELEKKGYFEIDNKKNLPYFPGKIAVVTSESGAVIEDITSIIKKRNPLVELVLYSISVQGSSAPGEIESILKKLNKNKDIDLVILGRGGGATEDLWAFNDSKVAEGIFNLNIPLISAVGHETDFTISDFVADKRAETPTAAAVIAVPDIEEILLEKKTLLELSRSSVANSFAFMEERLNTLFYRLKGADPRRAISSGYGAVLDEDSKLINSVKNIKSGDFLKIILKDGRVKVKVTEVEKTDEC